MGRLTNKDVKLWAQFYLRILAVNIWNGFTMWFRVMFSGLAAQGMGLIDVRGVGWKGAIWTLIGTICYRIAEAWFKNQLPEPTSPGSENES